jgi:transcriptional regulator with XRE-family HTH domain
MRSQSSGITDIDDVLSGLFVGDNVVWVGEREVHEAIEGPFLAEGARLDAPCVYATTTDTPRAVTARAGRHVEVIDARPGRRHADPMLLEQTLLERARSPGTRIVVDGLDSFVRRWRSTRALGLFSRVCPQMFDLGTIAYWRASTTGSRAILDDVRRVTQCFIDVSGGHLRVVKAEGRTGAQGRLFTLRLDGGAVHLDHERALGRLAEGLRVLRAERHLTQSDLARMVGVSPSAISQAEAGRRGLGLDTLLSLTEALGMGLDELLSSTPDSAYVLARRDRTAARRGITPLLDDPRTGLRAYLVLLGPGDRGEPPALHKGVELLVVAIGLVQIDIGDEGPVMRAGDAVLATRAPVRGWRNLVAQPARLFWILRDERTERPEA